MAKHIIILGAGACGLWAARELLKHPDVTVTLIEKEEEPGGLCRTTSRNGFSFDLGGHRFITANQPLAEEVLSFMGPRLLKSERKSQIYLQGNYFRYPVEPAELFRDKSIESLAMAGSLLLGRIRGLMPGHRRPDLASWLKQEYGNAIYSRFFKPYTTKVWGLAPEMLSAAWAAQRIPGMGLMALFKQWLGLSPTSSRSYAARYLYPQHGIGELFSVLSDLLLKQGARFHFSTEAVALKMEGDRVSAVECRNGREETTLPCDAVISTLPLPALTAFMGLEEELQAPLASLKFRAIRFLNIMLDCEFVSDNTWVYVPDPALPFARLQEPKKRSPLNAPLGKTSLMLEIPCNFGDAVWRMGQDELFNLCSPGLRSIGLGNLLKKMTGSFLTGVEHGYPVSTLKTPDDRRRVLERVWQAQNVVTCGRQGSFSYLFMDQSMEMGQMAARKVLNWESVTARQLYGFSDNKGYVEGNAVMQ